MPTNQTINHIYRTNLSTGQVIYDTLLGTRIQSATTVPGNTPLGRLIGATPVSNGTKKLVYFDSSKNAVSLSYYGGATQETLLGSSPLTTLAAGWKAQAVADLKGDGGLDVIAANASTGEVEVYSFGGAQGSSLVGKEMIAPLSVSGWNVVSALDLNADGHADLVLQNASTREVMAAYLGGSNGTTVLSTHNLESSNFGGWTASGMQDMNGDGHADLVLVNDATGESIVNYYGGEMGATYVGSANLDRSGALGWKIVVPTSTGATTATTTTATTGTPTSGATTTSATLAASTSTLSPQPTVTTSVPVLIFNGTGTSSSDVGAVESLVKSMGLAYHTANSTQLNSMSVTQLRAYRLFLMPGGNSITIGHYLSKTATSNVHSAVSQGLNYLGICAGGFFGGFSSSNNFSNLTSGVWFSVYSNNGKGIGPTAVPISFPNGSKLDIYWQWGPELNGWGKVVAKYSNGQAAITEGSWGQGFVVLSGLHPEAPASWRYGMTFFTPLDVDLAYARTLVHAALTRSMLPHY
jgi:hypothetical protein